MEMISGPDLGAGFLYQLTREPAGEIARFVFHAQDGGVDANGPPKGTPEPFGWSRSDGMCPLGGRTCWHREFWLPGSEALHVRTSYNRTRFVMEASLEQAYGARPVPLEAALDELVRRCPPDPTGGEPAWSLVGPTARWVEGLGAPPGRIEIETSEAGVRRWAERFEEYLIEPAARTSWLGVGRRFAARAFVGTLQVGARVEWSEPDPAVAPTGRAAPGTEWVDWKGHRVPCPARP
jgi:hypothetical protein